MPVIDGKRYPRGFEVDTVVRFRDLNSRWALVFIIEGASSDARYMRGAYPDRIVVVATGQRALASKYDIGPDTEVRIVGSLSA